MSNYLNRSTTETRDEAFKRMRAGVVTSDDFTSEKPRHRRVAYICAIQVGNLTKEQATAMEEKYQKPSKLVLSVISRLQDDTLEVTIVPEHNPGLSRVEHPEGSLDGEDVN